MLLLRVAHKGPFNCAILWRKLIKIKYEVQLNLWGISMHSAYISSFIPPFTVAVFPFLFFQACNPVVNNKI
jgi:hypothetical protein